MPFLLTKVFQDKRIPLRACLANLSIERRVGTSMESRRAASTCKSLLPREFLTIKPMASRTFMREGISAQSMRLSRGPSRQCKQRPTAPWHIPENLPAESSLQRPISGEHFGTHWLAADIKNLTGHAAQACEVLAARWKQVRTESQERPPLLLRVQALREHSSGMLAATASGDICASPCSLAAMPRRSSSPQLPSTSSMRWSHVRKSFLSSIILKAGNRSTFMPDRRSIAALRLTATWSSIAAALAAASGDNFCKDRAWAAG
mmetsp:Transcript_35180/g.109532  ORF Transcript_35180/g.109532 Transcript_35180/m.109532 type:complete len:262 (-) Transcript_35180:777-1562(-)